MHTVYINSLCFLFVSMIVFEHLMLNHAYCPPSSLPISIYGHARIIEEYTAFSQTSLTIPLTIIAYSADYNLYHVI